MDKLKDLTGTWRGTYEHDPSDLFPKGEPVPFILVLEQGWFGHFKGSVREEGPNAMPGTGSIDGYLGFPRIAFTKRMPVSYTVTPDGRPITLRDYLIGQGFPCEHDLPHPPVFYKGEFYATKQARGTWLIRAERLSLAGGAVLPMPQTTGVWNITA